MNIYVEDVRILVHSETLFPLPFLHNLGTTDQVELINFRDPKHKILPFPSNSEKLELIDLQNPNPQSF